MTEDKFVKSAADACAPKDALAVAPDSRTKFDPSPTIKLLSVGVKPAISLSCASKAWTFVPISNPKAVLAALALVAPVPPSPIASVPVIELAARSTAISEDSITSPPFDLSQQILYYLFFLNHLLL